MKSLARQLTSILTSGKKCVLALVCLAFLVSPTSGLAVPVTFQYQGHIIVNGQAHEGPGFFKFSLVSQPGEPGEAVVWSNDKAQGSANEPSAAIELTLRRGVYNVSLGDGSLPNMAPIAPEVFTMDRLGLRIWFSPDGMLFNQLTPDTQIGSVAFAVRAGTVDRVEETALPSRVTELLTLMNNLSLVSESDSDPGLIAAGYHVFGRQAAIPWSDGPVGEPGARGGHSGVWTGSGYIVWGGETTGAVRLNSGGNYDPSSNAWTGLSPVDAPSARVRHEAVWCNDRMIVWGGLVPPGDVAGGQYFPANLSWGPIADGPLDSRESHAMLCVGSRVLIWGGRNAVGLLSDGALFDPRTDQWELTPVSGMTSRVSMSAVWTGTEAIFWGGLGANGELNDGARLRVSPGNPLAWSSVDNQNAPSPRQGHSAVWTGNRMIIWGGLGQGGFMNDGFSYDPVADEWVPISGQGAPSGRHSHLSVWTGQEMVILFGTGANGASGTAHAYNPMMDSWRQLEGGGNAVTRSGGVAVWTGTEILVFGGRSGNLVLGNLLRIDPEPPVYLYRK